MAAVCEGAPYTTCLQELLYLAGAPAAGLLPEGLFRLLYSEGDALWGPGTGAASTLNGSGSPLQLVLSTGAHPVRVLADVGTSNGRQSRRLEIGLDRARTLAGRMGLRRGLKEVSTLLETTLPGRRDEIDALRAGTIWLAVGYGLRGPDRLSIYANAAWGADPHERWMRPFRLLLRIGGEASAAWLKARLPGLIDRVAPAGCALDFAASGVRAVKLYFRTTACGGEAVGAELAHIIRPQAGRDLRGLADALFEAGELPRGTFLALLFRPGREAPEGIKIDVCAHCTRLGEREIAARWERYARSLGVDDQLYRSAVQRLVIASPQAALRHANLGIGFGTDALRLDAYFQPASPHPLSAPGDSPLERSLLSGIRYLLGRQQPDGHWRDFRLPVGSSTAWVTAVTGRALAAVRPRAVEPRLDAAIESAAAWLAANERPGGGWGYGARVPADSDTTAHAALFLLEAPGTLGRRPVEVLLRCNRRDGGFATYPAESATGGWITSQPDITPVVALALAHVLGRDAAVVRAALAYCRRWLEPGVWVPSYWWNSRFYAPAMMALLFADVVGAVPKALLPCPSDSPETCLDRGLAIMALAAGGAVSPAGAAALVREQECDGAWPASAQLCVTNPDCLEPWTEADGYARRFADQDRVFTTAIAVHALALALAGRQGCPTA